MANVRPLIFFDTETTGLNPRAGNEIIHAYAKALNPWDFSDHPEGSIEILLKPNFPDKASPEALKIIGPLWDRALAEGVDQKVGLTKLHQWMEKINPKKGSFMTRPIFWAHNKDFDSRFTRYWMEYYKIIKQDEKTGECAVPWGFEFDTMQLAWTIFESDPMVENLKLDTVLGQIGLAREGVCHGAKEDVELLVQFFRRAMAYQRRCKKQMVIAKS